MQETWVLSLGWEDPLQKGKATLFSILAWRIPMTIQSMRLQRVGHNLTTFTFTCLKYSLGISNFLKKSLVFPILLFSSISFHWSLRKSFLSLLAVLWNCAFRQVYPFFSPLPFTSLLFSNICKVSLDNHFSFFPFLFLGMVLISASCTVSWNSVHISSGILSDVISWIYLSLLLYNCKGFDLSHTWMV